MMTDEQKSKVAELKAAIASTSTSTNGAPQEIREAVVTLRKELRREGTTSRALATALGVHETTLCRWERDGEVRPKRRTRARDFRMVRVTKPAPLTTTTPALPRAATASSAAIPRGLRVAHAPSGLVVDGLDVETLVVLLRRMS